MQLGLTCSADVDQVIYGVLGLSSKTPFWRGWVGFWLKNSIVFPIPTYRGHYLTISVILFAWSEIRSWRD